MKQQKIGIWTTGLSFVAIGLILLFSINGSIPWNTLKYLWPVILIAFGVEAILTRVVYPNARLRFSAFSIFVILLICLASFTGFVFPGFTMAPSYLVRVSGDVNVGSNVKKVEIHLVDGNISVTGTKSDRMTFSGELRIFASSERSAQEKLQSEWTVETNGDTLEIIQQQQENSIPISLFQWNSKSPHLEVEVPQRLLSDVSTNNGMVEVTHMNADSKAETSNGRIRVRIPKGADCRLTGDTSNGRISGNIEWQFDGEDDNHGTATLGNGRYTVDMHTSNGAIEVNEGN